MNSYHDWVNNTISHNTRAKPEACKAWIRVQGTARDGEKAEYTRQYMSPVPPIYLLIKT